MLTTRDLDSIPKSIFKTSNKNSTEKFDSSWITDIKKQLKCTKSLT